MKTLLNFIEKHFYILITIEISVIVVAWIVTFYKMIT